MTPGGAGPAARGHRAGPENPPGTCPRLRRPPAVTETTTGTFHGPYEISADPARIEVGFRPPENPDKWRALGHR